MVIHRSICEFSVYSMVYGKPSMCASWNHPISCTLPQVRGLGRQGCVNVTEESGYLVVMIPPTLLPRILGQLQ